MTSLFWIKLTIYEEWADSMPNRFDAERAEREAGPDGVIRDYENSYSMHHKMVEATQAEINVLTERFKKAEAGRIRWDEERQELYEIDE
jgi:hypothetical protein